MTSFAHSRAYVRPNRMTRRGKECVIFAYNHFIDWLVLPTFIKIFRTNKQYESCCCDRPFNGLFCSGAKWYSFPIIWFFPYEKKTQIIEIDVSFSNNVWRSKQIQITDKRQLKCVMKNLHVKSGGVFRWSVDWRQSNYVVLFASTKSLKSRKHTHHWAEAVRFRFNCIKDEPDKNYNQCVNTLQSNERLGDENCFRTSFSGGVPRYAGMAYFGMAVLTQTNVYFLFWRR